MKRISCLKNVLQKQTSYALLSTMLLLALMSSLALGIFLVHANEIASLQNINHYYEKRLQHLVQSKQDP